MRDEDATKKAPTDQSSNQGQWGPPLKGHQGEADEEYHEDLAHTEISTTARKKGSRREASERWFIGDVWGTVYFLFARQPVCP
jgi:hypothetical protein